MLFIIPNLLWGQAEPDATEDENTDDTKQKDEQTITKSELESILQEERDRITAETQKKLEKEYKSQLRPDKIAGLDWDDAVKLVQQSVSDQEEEEEEESEQTKALRTTYEAQIREFEKNLEQDKTAQAKLEQELKTERIDNAILNELHARGTHSKNLIMLGLRDNVILDDDNQPRVVNDKNEPRMITKEIATDDGKRLKPVEMSISDLIDEFLKKDDNQHFLPASPREGSGSRSVLPLGKKEALDAEYQDEMKKSMRRGKPTPELLKLQVQRKTAAA